MRLTVASTVREMTVETQAQSGKSPAENQSKSCSRLGTPSPIDQTTVSSMFQQHDLTTQEDRPPGPSLAATAAAPQFKSEGFMKSSILTQRVLINGMRPLALTKKQAIAVLV